jgi:hypothetical protein
MEKKSPDSLKHEDWFMEKLESGSGALVETKLGPGITKNEDNPINGKVPVYLNDGRKVLCSIHNIKVVGFYD